MSIKKCRVCNGSFFKEPLIYQKNMPKSAQMLPKASDLKMDKGIDLKVYQCSGCGLVQLNNDPVPYYREVIRATGFSKEMINFRMKQFSAFIKKYSLTNKKIIEIGCGKGEYLSIMKKFNKKSYGIEYSNSAVKECKGKRLNVAKGFIEKNDIKLKDAPFDSFYIMSFLEHHPNPNKTLKGIYNNLSGNAVGIVEVPNFNMIIKKKLFSEFIPDHLLYFTKETLSSTLNQNGFDIIECKEIWHDYIISAVVKKREKLPLTHFKKHQQKIQKEITGYIKKFKSKKVAIWGAGHQALAVIALLKMSGKIKYIIDSAPFKQNRYSPATHIPIVSPEKLNTDPVDSIIVIAGSYSDEVSKIIKQKYTKKIKIAILRDHGLEKI